MDITKNKDEALQDLKEKMVAVLGFGMEGKAVATYLLKHGVKPVLFDQRPWDEWPVDEQDFIKSLGLNFIFGPDWLNELKGFDVAFRSPGIKLKDLKIEDLKITSQTKWFFEHCPAKIIGVTGTKGKGTTSALIYEILSQQGFKTFLTGNIGKIQPLDFLEDLSATDWVVYELSSFQLQDLHQSPHIAVVLMTTSEHLDYHKNQLEYLEAKSSIAKFQNAGDFTVINADFENSIKIGELGEGRKLYFSRHGRMEADCYAKDGSIVLAEEVPILNAADFSLKGEHNLENVCAAILAAKAAGADLEQIKKTSISFKGLEHRLEFVREKDGIKFYNDSFSTTPETAIAAIKAFTEPLVVVLGGSGKNSDFTELGKVVTEAENIKAIIFIGSESKRIEDAINKAGGFKNFILTGAKNMEEIFAQIKSVARNGDAVVLSPACTSFGMFTNYKDRGEKFKKQVFLY